MKKTFRTIISFISVALILVSFSSCTLIEAMKNGALQAGETTIYASPEADKIVAEFNGYLENSKTTAVKITENISYSAGGPDVFKAGEEAGILDAAANQLKNFIMSANPGSESKEIAKDDDNNLLNKLDEASVLKFDFTRNTVTENVTNEESENVTDEENNPVTEIKVSDNVIHLTFNYFDYVPVTDEAPSAEADTASQETDTAEAETEETTEAETEATDAETEEEAETEAEETTLIVVDDATIESVFGTNKDKQIVLANFDCIKEYIVVKDYKITYTNCVITADANIETETLSFVNFQKNMTVTATVEGVGALASYGEMEIVFDLTMNTRYEFTYEEADEADTDAQTSEDTTVQSDDETTVAAEETTVAAEETTENAESSTDETPSEETTAA